MGRRRQLYRARQTIREQTSGTPSLPKPPSRTLSDSELDQIRAQLQHYQNQPELGVDPQTGNPITVSQLMGKWIRQQLQIQPGTTAWGQYIRVLKAYKIQTVGETAKGGRKSYAETIPDFKNIVWTQHALGKTLPQIVEELTKRKKLKAEEIPDERTIRRFLEKNPVPENFGAIGELQDSPEFQRWQTYMKERKRVGLGQLEKLKGEIINIFIFLNKKNPKLWTVEDLRAYEKHRTTELKGSSMRKVVNAIRSFAEYGLEQENWKKEFITSPYPKRSYSVIYAFSEQGYQNLLRNIPNQDYSFEFKTTDGKLIKKHIDLTNPVDLAEVLSWTQFCAGTGTRSGDLATGNDVIHALETGKMSHMVDHGSVSIRVSDINWQAMKVKAIYEKLHKEADKAWTDVRIPPKAYEALRRYICLRFNLPLATNEHDHEPWVKKFTEPMTHLAFRLNAAFEAEQTQIMEQIKTIFQSNRPDHEKHREIRHLWQQRNDAFAKVALFPHTADYYNIAIYCAVHNALQHGTPVTDNQDGAPWTPSRIYDEQHVAHLLRKSFAQFLVDHEVPMEVVASYAVGWDDLSTLFSMYGKVSKKKLDKTYESLVKQYF